LSEIDWEKVKEYAAILEKEQKLKLAKARIFSVKEVVQDSKEIQHLFDPELGIVQYGLLTNNDLFEINEKAKDNQERGLWVLWKMLQKADHSITLDDIKEMPISVSGKLLGLLVKKAGFLQLMRELPSGSTQAETPSESVSSPTSFK
jgi:hypothetical protein